MNWAVLGAGAYLAGAVPLLRRRVICVERQNRCREAFHVEHLWLWWLVGVLSGIHAVVLVETSAPEQMPLVAAWILILPAAVALTVVDVLEFRLPDHLTYPTLGIAIVLVGLALVGTDGAAMELDVTATLHAAARALAGAAALGAIYFVLVIISAGRGMGLGDAKLAPTLGLFTAANGWDTWVEALVWPFLLGGSWGGFVLLGGVTVSSRIPFGPFMILGNAITFVT